MMRIRGCTSRWHFSRRWAASCLSVSVAEATTGTLWLHVLAGRHLQDYQIQPASVFPLCVHERWLCSGCSVRNTVRKCCQHIRGTATYPPLERWLETFLVYGWLQRGWNKFSGVCFHRLLHMSFCYVHSISHGEAPPFTCLCISLRNYYCICWYMYVIEVMFLFLFVCLFVCCSL